MASGDEKATPVQIRAATDVGKATLVQIRAATDVGKASPVQIQVATDAGKASPVQIKAATDTGKASPVQIKAATDAGKASPVQIKAATDAGKASPVQIEAATDAGKASPVQIEAAASEKSVEKKSSPTKRSLSQLTATDLLEVEAKRSRQETRPGEPELKELFQDVLTLKRNLAVDGEDCEFVKVLCTKVSRPGPSQWGDPVGLLPPQNKLPSVLAESPREAFTLAKALKNFAKYRNMAEKRLVRREISANVRDVHQDLRDVRQDHRDVRQDHRDVRQEGMQKTIDDSKRALDMCWARFDAFRAAAGKGSGQGHAAGSGQGHAAGSGKKEEPNKEEPNKEEEHNNKEEHNKKEEPNKEEEHNKKEEPNKTVLASVTETLDKAETLVNLSGKAVDLGDKVIDVASRAKVIANTAAENSTILKTILAGLVSCASALARKALKELAEGESDGDD